MKGFLRLCQGRNANKPQNSAVQSFIGVCTPRQGSPVGTAGRGSCAQTGNMAGFYARNSGWLSSWGLGIGLLEQSGNLSLMVPWFDVSRLFQVVDRLPLCPTLPILTDNIQRTLRAYSESGSVS